MFKKTNQRRLRRINKGGCKFCLEKNTPNYIVPDSLKEYMSERGKIMGKDRTGVCPKHQKILACEIKRARHLALLPFVNKI